MTPQTDRDYAPMHQADSQIGGELDSQNEPEDWRTLRPEGRQTGGQGPPQ